MVLHQVLATGLLTEYLVYVIPGIFLEVHFIIGILVSKKWNSVIDSRLCLPELWWCLLSIVGNHAYVGQHCRTLISGVAFASCLHETCSHPLRWPWKELPRAKEVILEALLKCKNQLDVICSFMFTLGWGQNAVIRLVRKWYPFFLWCCFSWCRFFSLFISAFYTNLHFLPFGCTIILLCWDCFIMECLN